jgi:hypothetical protein
MNLKRSLRSPSLDQHDLISIVFVYLNVSVHQFCRLVNQHKTDLACSVLYWNTSSEIVVVGQLASACSMVYRGLCILLVHMLTGILIVFSSSNSHQRENIFCVDEFEHSIHMHNTRRSQHKSKF